MVTAVFVVISTEQIQNFQSIIISCRGWQALLDDDDDETQMKASEQNQTASGITTTTLGCEQVDQADNISSPAEQDQHHENNVRVVGATKTQREAEARAGSRDQDQNFYGQNGHPKRANEKQGSEFK